MFRYNTTTVINSNTDFTTGEPLLVSGDDSLQVKRGLTFKKKYVKAIYKREYNDPELAKVEVDLSGVTEVGVYRIAMYIRLEGSNNEYYANDYVFKGKPFYIEFTKKTANESGLAGKVVNIAKKYQQMVYEYPLVKVTSSGDVVTFEATDEYQRFTKVELQYFNETGGLPTGCCGDGAGEWTTLEKLDVNATTNGDGAITWGEDDGKLLKGKEGFGTYRNLVKNLRLPTADNLRWGHILQDEVPVPGATYNQYTIYYCRKVGVQGLAHVGDLVQSLTSHIFFVNTCMTDDFETYLANLGTVVPVEDAGDPETTNFEKVWEDSESGSGSNSGNESGNESGSNSGNGTTNP